MAPPPLPNSTPQAFAAYLNAHFSDTKGHKGAPISLSGVPAGKTLGDQWLAWYAQETKAGKTGTLLQFEEAFIVLWSDYTLGADLGAGITGGARVIGTSVNQIPSGINNALGGVPAALSSWETALTGFLADLTSSAVWLRVAKVVIGGVLLLIGVAKMTGTDSAVTKIARKVPLVPV